LPRQTSARSPRPGMPGGRDERGDHVYNGRLRAGRVAGAAAAALVAGLLAAGCTAGPAPASGSQGLVAANPGTTVFNTGKGLFAPAVTGPLVGGGKLSLASYRGHVVVLNFWGSWCGDCREEAPDLSAAASHFKAAGVQFLGVDIEDSPASAKAYMATFRISYPSFSDPGDNIALAFRDSVPTQAIPSTLVIAGTGRISARVIGRVTYAGLVNLINRAVA
jgi:thiol-disulfide isomerase/thioredoxin